MSRDVPTDEELAAAETYALSKLCTEIPSKYGRGLTRWDSTKKQCQITKAGCTPNSNNPISVLKYNSKGTEMDVDKKHRIYGSFWKYYDPAFLVMKTTTKSPKTQVCSRGNFLLYKWCEYPATRSDKSQPGVTEANKKFEYAIKNGKETCIIPEEYCKSKGIGYSKMENTCVVSTSQKQIEWLTSPEFIRSAKLSDMRLKSNIQLYKKDFPAKNINLYTYTWKPLAYKLYGNAGDDLGFVADNLPLKYIYIDENGYKNINLDVEDETMTYIKNFIMIKKSISNILLNYEIPNNREKY